jgi:hypothetical protein
VNFEAFLIMIIFSDNSQLKFVLQTCISTAHERLRPVDISDEIMQDTEVRMKNHSAPYLNGSRDTPGILVGRSCVIGTLALCNAQWIATLASINSAQVRNTFAKLHISLPASAVSKRISPIASPPSLAPGIP